MPQGVRPRAPEDEEVPEKDKRKDEETDKRCDPTAYPIVRQYHCVLPVIPAKNGLPSLWVDRDRSVLGSLPVSSRDDRPPVVQVGRPVSSMS